MLECGRAGEDVSGGKYSGFTSEKEREIKRKKERNTTSRRKYEK